MWVVVAVRRCMFDDDGDCEFNFARGRSLLGCFVTEVLCLDCGAFLDCLFEG